MRTTLFVTVFLTLLHPGIASAQAQDCKALSLGTILGELSIARQSAPEAQRTPEIDSDAEKVALASLVNCHVIKAQEAAEEGWDARQWDGFDLKTNFKEEQATTSPTGEAVPEKDYEDYIIELKYRIGSWPFPWFQGESDSSGLNSLSLNLGRPEFRIVTHVKYQNTRTFFSGVHDRVERWTFYPFEFAFPLPGKFEGSLKYGYGKSQTTEIKDDVPLRYRDDEHVVTFGIERKFSSRWSLVLEWDTRFGDFLHDETSDAFNVGFSYSPGN